MKKKYIMGNWKMNMLPDEAAKYMEGINRLTTMLKGKEDVRKIVLFVPSVDYYIANLMKEEQIYVGLQNISKENISNEEDLIIAYEPIWAIGTGKVCSSDDADNMCKVIRDKVKEILDIDVPVLYGGSVNEQNSNEILLKENIDGVLVGGASLDPEKFAKIIYSGHKLGE